MEEIKEIKKRLAFECHTVEYHIEAIGDTPIINWGQALQDINHLLSHLKQWEQLIEEYKTSLSAARVKELEEKLNGINGVLGEHAIEMTIIKLRARIKELEEARTLEAQRGDYWIEKYKKLEGGD